MSEMWRIWRKGRLDRVSDTARAGRSDAIVRRHHLVAHVRRGLSHAARDVLPDDRIDPLRRRVDDDDPEAAKKALDDLDELAVTDISKAPATRFKLHLDLAAEDVNVGWAEVKTFVVGRAAAPHAVRLSLCTPPTPEETERGLEILDGLLARAPAVSQALV